MSETKFSKGPWRLKQSNGGRLHLLSNIGAQIAALWNCRERNANAHLIAAAPEMYEMLDMLTDSKNNEDLAHIIIENYEDIRKLLAKARGEHD